MKLTTEKLAEWSFLKVFRPLLKSDLLWRLTGISLSTALLATKGHTSFDRYTMQCKEFAFEIRRYLSSTDIVLDLGCGIGGMAFELSRFCKMVVGIDVNRGYIRIAKKLYGKRTSKVKFQWYNGKHIPFNKNSFDFIYAHAVFERIRKATVKDYLREFSRVLKPNKCLYADFLRKEAISSGLTDLLGSNAYVFWSEDEIAEVLANSEFKILNLTRTPEKFVVFAINLKEQG